MEQVMEIVDQLIDSFITSGEAKTREEVKQMTVELIRKYANENK